MLEKIKMKFLKPKDNELNDYLKKFNCNNCHNHCSLNKIKCHRGSELRDDKIKEFNNNK